MLLSRIGAQIEQQELAAINEQLPLTRPDSPLLAVGLRYSPEQLPVSERRIATQDGKEINPFGAMAGRRPGARGCHDSCGQIHRYGDLLGGLPGMQPRRPAQEQRDADPALT